MAGWSSASAIVCCTTCTTPKMPCRQLFSFWPGRPGPEAGRNRLPTGYFEPLDPDVKSYEKQPMRIVPLNDDGTHDMTPLNGDFSTDYLAVKGNPRWLAKPTVAYIW